MFRLDAKTALVTGAASGIGQAISELFAAQGAVVHLVDIRPEGASAVAGQIRQAGGNAVAHACDLTDEEAAGRLFAGILDGGRIDILVNSIGMAQIGSLETTTPAEFDQIFTVNVKSYYIAMRHVIGHMKSKRSGVILNIASIAGSAGLANRFGYSMTKGAVLAMTYSVAKDYVESGIRCNSISPARVHTPFVDGFLKRAYPGREDEMYRILSKSQPIGRMGKPQEVAALALYLCSEEAAFITGTDYPIDGGFLKLHG
jgi:NAD(P)-dependent dehydrogenase (short-subunit alcohol dehydrogenase family)